ncbi:MAG: tetratricopeptide repeat protein [Pseudomonadota bacterium]|nr:tetratricopeptide repeat protein [Pseudomonadota bacterium]
MDRRAGGLRDRRGTGRTGAPARAEDIARAVLSALADWQSSARPPEALWKRAFKFLSEHWPMLTVLVTLVTAAGAMFLEGFSPRYPFRALAFNEKELAHRELEFKEQQEAFERAAQERGLKATLAQDSVRLAKSFLDVGQIEEAKRAYEKALELDPLHLEARHGRFKTEVYGMAAAGQHDPEIIRKRLESLLAIDAKDPHALSMLGNLYARAGLGREEAIGKYRQAIAIDPTVAEAHFGLATLYLKDEDLAEAQGPIEEAVQLSPWNPRYLETLAYVRDRRGNVREALELYQRAINLDGQYLSPYFEIAALQRRQGYLEGALATGQRLAALLDDPKISALPKNQEALYSLVEERPVYLRQPEAKRCYAYWTVSATAYLLQQPEVARDAAARARALSIPNHLE